MSKIYTLLVAIVLMVAQLVGFSQEIELKTHIKSGVYQKGQAIRVTAVLTNVDSDSLHVRVLKNNIHSIYKKAFVPKQGELMVFEGTFREATSLIIEAECGTAMTAIGCVVASSAFEPGFTRPKDFDRFWDNQKKQLAALPFDVKKEPVELPAGNENYECFDMELNCVGPKPARGYLAKPQGAKPKSLPIVIYVRAAGVKGSWCKSNIDEALSFAKRGNGALCFDLNAHGMLTGQPDNYYEELETRELNEYWLQGIESRDTYYFRGMYLRVLRTIEFMTRQPEWDGKRILVIGESQGGGQALAAAGLDKRVTAVVATVPAMCDWGGALVGRKGGWPQPIESVEKSDQVLATLPYFDTALLLFESKATLVVEIGLIDQICPATSIYAAINQSQGQKMLYVVPYRTHAWPEKPHRETWDRTVFAAKNNFVDSYLK